MRHDNTPAYLFAELTPRAQTRALASLTTMLPPWRGEPGVADQLAAALATTLATALDLDDAGDLEVTAWDDDRACRWSLAGTLRPDTAPTLPWTPGIHTVDIAWHRRIHIHANGQPATAEVNAMRTAVAASIATAWQSAHQQVAARQALEWAAACGPRFTAAGALATNLAHPGRELTPPKHLADIKHPPAWHKPGPLTHQASTRHLDCPESEPNVDPHRLT